MKVTPEIDVRDGNLMRVLTARKIYDVITATATHYTVTNDLGVDTAYVIEKFVVVPDNLALDSRSIKDIIYDDLKQRDSDYHKVYKERMGIEVMTWAEEDRRRHGETKTGTDGLPEGHAIRRQETKNL